MKNKFYLTTTLAYVNDVPHIGFALELIQADVLVRYARMRGDDVFFLTGTDEHGSKIAKTAAEKGISPKKLADTNSKEFQKLKKILNLSVDDFIRTTDRKKHWPGAEKLWNEIVKSGDIYKRTYQGLYCGGCEVFLGERDLTGGKCLIHKKEPELLEEENYFFRLSLYGKMIKQKIESGEFQIFPEWRAKEILTLIDKGLEDVSFSRPTAKLSWGIPVPGDASQIMYVWADALSNYVSAIGYGRDEETFRSWWPAEAQVLGKDVLRFHAAIWPAMLLSAKLPLPKKLFVHGFVNIDGQKISKSLGNVIHPAALTKRFGIDPTRYYFLREISPFDDGDYSEEKFKERYAADLSHGLGNFASRVTTLAEKFGPIKSDFSMMELSLEQKIKTIKEKLDECMETFRFNEALSEIWSLIAAGDKYINEQQPWLATHTQPRNEKTLYNLLVLLQSVSVFILPFLPETSKIISRHLSLKGKTIKVKKIASLFPRLEE